VNIHYVSSQHSLAGTSNTTKEDRSSSAPSRFSGAAESRKFCLQSCEIHLHRGPPPLFVSVTTSWHVQTVRQVQALPPRRTQTYYSATLYYTTMAAKQKDHLALDPHRYPPPLHCIDQNDMMARLESQDKTIRYDAKRNPCCGFCWEPRNDGHPLPLECDGPCGACGQSDHNGFVS
jgi:hypothetical protein